MGNKISGHPAICWGNCFLAVASASVTYILGMYIEKTFIQKESTELEEETEEENEEVVKYCDLWNTVVFFPDYRPNKEDSSTAQLLWYVEQAKNSIDVCMYRLDFPQMEKILRLKSVAKIPVRVLTNDCLPLEQTEQLKKDGVQFREKIHKFKDPINDLMHHKFVNIDGFATITGSLNWSIVSIMSNRENVVVTTDKNIVPKYIAEFERVWNEADPGRH